MQATVPKREIKQFVRAALSCEKPTALSKDVPKNEIAIIPLKLTVTLRIKESISPRRVGLKFRSI